MSREAFEKWKKDKGVNYNAAQAWQAAWGEQQKRIEELETRINLLIQKWEKDAEYADQIASEDFVQNTLNDCIEELRQVIKGGDE